MITQSHDGLEATDHDVCVVGAGPVGISLAVRLQRLGLKVLVLESGGRGPDTSVQQLGEATRSHPRAHDPMDLATARRLGGTSNLWGGRCMPFDEIDFQLRPGLADTDWPISLRDIEPYYPEACDAVDCGEPVFTDYPAGVPDVGGDFRIDALERWSGTPKLQLRHARILESSPLIDVRLRTVVTGFNYTQDGRIGSVNVARPDGSGKRTIDVKLVALATGGIEATRLLLAEQRLRPAAFGGPDGPLGRYHMAHVVGVIADITFANEPIDGAFDFFRASDGAYVRRRMSPSAELQLRQGFRNVSFWPVVPEISDASHGSGPLSAIFLGLAWGPMGRLLIPEALRVRHVPKHPTPFLPHMLNVIKNAPSTIPYIINFMRNRYLSRRRVPGFFLRNPNFKYGLMYHSEQWPNPDNRITLTDSFDRLGMPVANLGFHFHERDAQSLLTAHDALDAWLRTTGLGGLSHRHAPDKRVEAILNQAKHGPHQIGTIRMARNSSLGVVDSDLRAFDCANLFVASSATFPTSGQANPTLTAIALALRLADTLASERRSAFARAA